MAINREIRVCWHDYALIIYWLLFVVMAGLASEGSQFDARHYDAKMTEL
jgi:hypothetical protein